MKWSEYKLANLTEKFISGGTPSTKVDDYWHGNIPWITGADFTDEDIILGRRYINEDAIKNSSTNIVPKGSIIMVTRTGVGKIAIAQKDMAISQDITGIILKNGINTSYIVAAIKNKMATLLSAQRGATIKGITRKDVENLVLSTPSPSEQRKIVEILDQADRLRKLRAEADKRSERILPALFIKMFGDPATNPMGWETGILDDVIIETQYGTSTKAYTDGKGVSVIRMNNVDIVGNLDLSDIKYVELSEKEKKKHLLSKGDIIFNRTNSKELVGKTGIWPGYINAVMASYLIRVRTNPEKVVPEFIWASMNMPFMKQILLNKSRRAIGMANINAKELRSFPIFIPAKRVQQKFSAKLHHVNEIKSGRKISSEKLDKLFTLLLHRAFTGDLTASWRQAHMKELLKEMEIQARILAG